MSHTKEINGVPVLGSVIYKNKIYYLDIEENIYEFDLQSKFTLITDEILVKELLDYLEAKPLDIV